MPVPVPALRPTQLQQRMQLSTPRVRSSKACVAVAATQPTTPISRTRTAPPDVEETQATSKSLPGTPSAKLSTSLRFSFDVEDLAPRYGKRRPATMQFCPVPDAQIEPKATAALKEDLERLLLPVANKTEKFLQRRPPSYVFAAQEAGSEAPLRFEAGDPEGLTAARPAWCPVLTASDNGRLRSQLEAVLADQSHLRSRGSGLHCDSSWWHEEPEADGTLIEVLLRLGASYSALGRFAHAAQLLRRALIRVEDMARGFAACSSGASSGAEAMRAELLGTLSGVLCQQGLHAEAEAMLWQARQLAKIAGISELYVKLTCDLAEFNRKCKGNLKTAQRLFHKGLEMRIKTVGLENIDTASALHAAGVFAAQKGDYEEARRLITDSLRIRIKLLGRSHLSAAEAYHSLAAVHEALQSPAEAIQLYEAALHVKRHTLPEGHVSIVDSESQLTALYVRLRRHEDSLALLRSSLGRCLRTVGEKHGSTAKVLRDLGSALLGQALEAKGKETLKAYLAQLEEAQDFLERALAAAQAVFHQGHDTVASCRAELGQVHFHKQEYGKAEAHFASAMRIYRRRVCHPEVILMMLWLGKAQLEQPKRTAKGGRQLRRALCLWESCSARSGIKALASMRPLTLQHIEEIRALSTPKADSGPEEPAAEPPSSQHAQSAAEQSPKSPPHPATPTGRPRPPCLSPSASRTSSSQGSNISGSSGGADSSFIQHPAGSPGSHCSSIAITRASRSRGVTSSFAVPSPLPSHESSSDSRSSDSQEPSEMREETLDEVMSRVRKSASEYEAIQHRGPFLC